MEKNATKYRKDLKTVAITFYPNCNIRFGLYKKSLIFLAGVRGCVEVKIARPLTRACLISVAGQSQSDFKDTEK